MAGQFEVEFVSADLWLATNENPKANGIGAGVWDGRVVIAITTPDNGVVMAAMSPANFDRFASNLTDAIERADARMSAPADVRLN